MRFLLIPFLIFSFSSYSQCVSFVISKRGDTLNCTEKNAVKRGRWINRVETVRGEPGFEEEGIYKNDKKEGTWRVYTLMGDLFAIENYRWGNKDGISQYFNINGIVREESWKATNPENPYDTIEVPDPIDPFKVEMKVIKLEGSSAKHGIWKYYNSFGGLIKTENYFLDKIQIPGDETFTGTKPVTDTTIIKKAPEVKAKPKEVAEFEKKNKGKKSIKVIDGRTKNN
jgi:hypothetical protein